MGLTERFQTVHRGGQFFMLFLYLPSGMTPQAGKRKSNVRYFYHAELVPGARASDHQSDNCNYPNFDLLGRSNLFRAMECASPWKEEVPREERAIRR